MTRITRALFAALLVMTMAVSCTSSSAQPDRTSGPDTSTVTDGNSANGSDGKLVIGSVASLSGSAEAYGTSQQLGVELAAELESREDTLVSVEARDDASSEAGGTEAFSELIEQGVSVILGPTLSPVAAATKPLASAVGVPVLAVTNTTLDIDPDTDSVWRITLSERAMLPQGLTAARQSKGIESAVLVFDATDDYSLGAAAAFRGAAEKSGVSLTGDIGFNPGELTDAGYRRLLTNATEANPDAILFAARSAPATRLLENADALALPQKLIGSNGFNAPDVIMSAGPAAEDLTVVASWNPAVNDPASTTFVAAFTERHGRAPDAFAAQGYAGVQVALAAAKAGGGTSQADIRRGLRLLGTVDTVLGTIMFADNEAVYPAAIQSWRNGSFELIARGTP